MVPDFMVSSQTRSRSPTKNGSCRFYRQCHGYQQQRRPGERYRLCFIHFFRRTHAMCKRVKRLFICFSTFTLHSLPIRQGAGGEVQGRTPSISPENNNNSPLLRKSTSKQGFGFPWLFNLVGPPGAPGKMENKTIVILIGQHFECPAHIK